jgi:hypothetical protein
MAHIDEEWSTMNHTLRISAIIALLGAAVATMWFAPQYVDQRQVVECTIWRCL